MLSIGRYARQIAVFKALSVFVYLLEHSFAEPVACILVHAVQMLQCMASSHLQLACLVHVHCLW